MDKKFAMKYINISCDAFIFNISPRKSNAKGKVKGQGYTE